jgi:hypothetical protein
VGILVGETTVLLVVSIVIRVRLVVTVMIVLAGLIVTLLVEHLVVTVMTGLVRLIATHVLLVVLIVIRVRLVVTVMIVLAGLIVIHAHRVLQRRSVQMKLRVALANVAQVAKCLCHPSVLVKIG